MGIRVRALTAVLGVIGIVTAITACGNAGSSASSAGSTSPATSASSAGSASSASAPASATATPASTTGAIPAGDHRIGGPVQGISVEIPASFKVIDLTSLGSAQASISRLGLSGANANTIAKSIPEMEKLHGVVAVDAGSAAANGGFASNVNDYCVDSGTSLTGSDVVPAIKQGATALQTQLNAQNVTSTDKQIGGVAGVETTYQLQSSTFGTIYGSQLEVAAKPNKLCFVTLTQKQSSDAILSVAAQTALFY
jgi:hypothetical protein